MRMQKLINIRPKLDNDSQDILDKKIRYKFISIVKESFGIGCYGNIWKELNKIEKLEGGKDKAAERASTASIILMHHSKVNSL